MSTASDCVGRLHRATPAAGLLIALALIPGMAHGGESSISPCVQALEQLATLNTFVPVYKQLPHEERHYLNDADRPAEIARVKTIVSASCSADPALRTRDEAAAHRLHQARSPECAFERDRLAAMEQPGSRDSRDTIASQRKLVTERCPVVPLADVWLLQMVWASP